MTEEEHKGQARYSLSELGLHENECVQIVGKIAGTDVFRFKRKVVTRVVKKELPTIKYKLAPIYLSQDQIELVEGQIIEYNPFSKDFLGTLNKTKVREHLKQK